MGDGAWEHQRRLREAVVAARAPEEILAVVAELTDPIAVSTALHRLGRCGGKATCDDPRFEQLLWKLRAALPHFGPRQIANALHGLGALACLDAGPATQLLAVQVRRRLAEFEPRHVSSSLWACAKMRLRDAALLEALASRAIEDIAHFAAVDFSLVTWACGTLRLRDTNWLRAVVRVRPAFAEFSPQNMANFAWGMATLGFRHEKMLLALGREACRKIHEFKPQELSNYGWALATLDLVDNLVLEAISDEVERRALEVPQWDPQSLANLMWAFATLAVKDDHLFRRLIDAATTRIADFTCQELANSAWASAMVLFRDSRWLAALAAGAAARISQMEPMHLAQVAWAFSRFCYRADEAGLIPALAAEALRREADFPPQSLLDVHDALCFFGLGPELPAPVAAASDRICGRVESCIYAFADLGDPTSLPVVATYRKDLGDLDVTTLGVHHTADVLRRAGLLAGETAFAETARREIEAWRAELRAADPTSRAAFHRPQCAWRLRPRCGGGALAGGLLASDRAPQESSCCPLVPCRLRHERSGDAEFRALCAAAEVLESSTMASSNLELAIHVSDVPCISCLGAMVQFHRRWRGLLSVSFDRGREARIDTHLDPRPDRSIASNDANLPRLYGGGAVVPNGPGDGCDPRMSRPKDTSKEGLTTFYSGLLPDAQRSVPLARTPLLSAAAGHQNSSGQQTFYQLRCPVFYTVDDYEDFPCS